MNQGTPYPLHSGLRNGYGIYRLDQLYPSILVDGILLKYKIFLDLFIFNVKEHIETYRIKKEQDEIRNKFYKEIREKIKEVENFLKANP